MYFQIKLVSIVNKWKISVKKFESTSSINMAHEREKIIGDEYLSSLMDLNVNSKPLINMLTMLAEDNIEHAHVIVSVVAQHLAKVFTHF